MPLFEQLGFNGHPFAKTNADEEPNLSDYFVPPVYFDSIVGDAKSPTSSVVLAPRGAGKTAQRRMVEDRSNELGFLAVTYDRFEFSANDKVEKISLQYHLRNVITRVLVAILSYASDYPDVIRNLSKIERKEVGLFIHSYLGDLTGQEMQELLKELRSIPENIRKFWSENVGFLESVANYLLKAYDLEPIDLPDIKQEEKRLSATYKYQLESLLKFAKKIGFKSIYVLIDRVDETEQTGNDAEKTYNLIRPFIRDLELLGLEGYAFKFFLWDKIEDFYRIDARPDRVPQYKLKWARQALRQVLSARLSAFSDGSIRTIQALLTEDPGFDVDDSICVMANGSPRNMIRICERILTAQSERDPGSQKIDGAAIDRGILEFSETLILEQYGEEILRDMQRVGRALFTTNYVANDILKISGQGARNKITGWANTGAVKQVGTIAVPPATRPVNLYCAVDPVVVRIMHRTTPFKEFFLDRWHSCTDCETENLFDAKYYTGENPPVCRSCGRAFPEWAPSQTAHNEEG